MFEKESHIFDYNNYSNTALGEDTYFGFICSNTI